MATEHPSDDNLPDLQLPTLVDPVKQWIAKHGWVDAKVVDKASRDILRDHTVGPLIPHLLKAGHISQDQADHLQEVKLFSQVARRFTLEKKLGAGGVGAVYLATDNKNPEVQVAIKFLHAEISTLTEHRERFEREAAALDGVNHPVIPELIERSKGTDPKNIFLANKNLAAPYIAMEYVTGRTIGDLIKEAGQLDEQYTLWAVARLAHGLHHVHEHSGIIHRDIKPENIIVAMPEGTTLKELYQQRFALKILDFGLAKAGKTERSRYGPRERLDSSHADTPDLEEYNQVPDGGATMVGQIIGTPKYMAPEQVMGKELSWRADQYALGVTMFHMLTGHTPFNGPTPMAVLSAHLREKVPNPKGYRPGLSSRTVRILLRLLEKEPSSRFGSYLDVIEACKRAMHAIENPQSSSKSYRQGSPGTSGYRRISSGSNTVSGNDALDHLAETSVTTSLETAQVEATLGDTAVTEAGHELVALGGDGGDSDNEPATISLAKAMERSSQHRQRSPAEYHSTVSVRRPGTSAYRQPGTASYSGNNIAATSSDDDGLDFSPDSRRFMMVLVAAILAVIALAAVAFMAMTG